MKNLLLVLTLSLIAFPSFAGVCKKITTITQELDSSFWKNSKVSVLAEMPKTAPTHEFLEHDIIRDMAASRRCESSMTKTIFTVKTIPGQVFEAVISNEDGCDGGNAYGLVKSLNSDKVIATIEDSFINCID